MLEMSIDSIRVSMMNYQRVVILKEKDTDRYLPIWIGPAEADAIAVKLQDIAVPRPLTHDLLRSVIKELSGDVSRIHISDLQNDTFYARIIISINGKEMEVDSRPSDAIALAVRAQVPIYAEEQVLEKAGVQLDQETGKPIAQEQTDEDGEPAEVSEEEQRRMSAFTDFINSLDLDDLGNPQQG
jgi:bifunctional DNase/RNase